mmetsp:Transcript_62047/g.131048  ORF Transcript_62047/g.131048 Transcript_62047/m.131048 type:complete len:200 (-) Transcript_62047:3211-3810(-)
MPARGSTASCWSNLFNSSINRHVSARKALRPSDSVWIHSATRSCNKFSQHSFCRNSCHALICCCALSCRTWLFISSAEQERVDFSIATCAASWACLNSCANAEATSSVFFLSASTTESFPSRSATRREASWKSCCAASASCVACARRSSWPSRSLTSTISRRTCSSSRTERSSSLFFPTWAAWYLCCSVLQASINSLRY